MKKAAKARIFALRADMAAVLDREGAVCYNTVKVI